MHNININILLSTGDQPAFSPWELAPLTPIVVEVFIVLQELSYMEVTVAQPRTMTSPLCRSVFPSMFQYTIKLVLNTCSDNQLYLTLQLWIMHFF